MARWGKRRVLQKLQLSQRDSVVVIMVVRWCPIRVDSLSWWSDHSPFFPKRGSFIVHVGTGRGKAGTGEEEEAVEDEDPSNNATWVHSRTVAAGIMQIEIEISALRTNGHNTVGLGRPLR